MPTKMQEAINRFNNQNGDSNFSNKDMLKYIIYRIDSLPCDKHITLMAKTEARTKMLLFFIPTSLTVIGILIAVLATT